MIYTMNELKSILAKHNEWLTDSKFGSRANLSGANLSGADLSGANLSGADLSWADLSGANLSGANLSGADLSWADLSRANLSRADLSRANLSWANLSRADLSGANLSRADLSGANLSGADLSGANLSGANLILIGQDARGYLFYGYKNDGEVLVICAGCRTFTGMIAAHAHWDSRHLTSPILHEDILSLLDRGERMAKARGWKTEVK